MTKINRGLAAALLVLCAAANAAPGQDVNLDGSAKAGKKPATAASRPVQADAVPAARAAPVDVKAQADAEMAARDARSTGPRLQVKRRNLKADDTAARAMQRPPTPDSNDHTTAYGDMDHNEQVTNLLVPLKKKQP